MNSLCGQNDGGNNLPTAVAPCDNQQVNSETLYPPGECYECGVFGVCEQNSNGEFPDPDCYNTCEHDCTSEACPDFCMGPVDYLSYPSTGCASDQETNGCYCFRPSPILIDT